MVHISDIGICETILDFFMLFSIILCDLLYTIAILTTNPHYPLSAFMLFIRAATFPWKLLHLDAYKIPNKIKYILSWSVN